MWHNLGVSVPFIFFLMSKKKAINNSNPKRIFSRTWETVEAENWRKNEFSSTSVVRQLAPELITYWKEEE
jgi:hypothetical protein